MAEEHGEHHEEGHGGSHGGGHGGGHGGAGHGEEHEGAPEWLISFADNVMLQMGFFVILLAMNMGPKGGGDGDGDKKGGQSAEMLDFVLALREGFNNPVSVFSDRPEEAPLVKRMMERKGGEGRNEGPTGKYEKQQAPRPSDYDKVTAAVQFDDRSAEISPAQRATIADVAQRQKDQRWILEVRGHVSPFESMRNSDRAVQLSFDRANAVAKALAESGLPWANIRVVACGDGNRVVGRTTDRDADRGNQRVEIVLTNYTVGDDPYATPVEGK